MCLCVVTETFQVSDIHIEDKCLAIFKKDDRCKGETGGSQSGHSSAKLVSGIRIQAIAIGLVNLIALFKTMCISGRSASQGCK